MKSTRSDSSLQDYDPETELLCHCARKQIERERGTRMGVLLQENLDWGRIFRMADHHHMMALLYSSLSQIRPNHVPKETLQLLRDHYFVHVVRNGYKTKELLKLLKVFQTHNIPAIPYKGAILSTLLFGDPLLRHYSDLDLLIFKKDLAQVEEVLSCQGYQLQWTHGEKNWALKHHFHLPFVKMESKIHVEIHWAFTRTFWSFPIDIEQLWQRIQTVTLGGESVPSFHPEDLLLLLCVHGAKDYWCRLKWISDIAELLRLHRDLDWQALFDKAKKLRSVRILALGIFLAHDLLDGPLPDDVRCKVRADPIVLELGNHLRQNLFTGQLGKGEYRKRASYYSRLREKTRDKIPVYFHFLYLDMLSAFRPLLFAIKPNAKDREIVDLPNSLFFLYYLIRVIRLAREKCRLSLK